jgi:hypothetical protein
MGLEGTGKKPVPPSIAKSISRKRMSSKLAAVFYRFACPRTIFFTLRFFDPRA